MRYFVVDAFTDQLFAGNPAGVCLLDHWLPDATLQNIARENNLSETAFVVPANPIQAAAGADYQLRWFTPELEVNLCGHATLASAFALFNFKETSAQKLNFQSLSGRLTVERGPDGRLWLDFPARPATPTVNYPALIAAFGRSDFQTWLSNDILVVFAQADQVRQLQPDFEQMQAVKQQAQMASDDFGVIITAPGEDCDFVSRFFGPLVGVPEDPVTGRAHCVLTPYWSQRLGKSQLVARQLSQRGGRLWCENQGDRVRIGGQARLYLQGEIHLSD